MHLDMASALRGESGYPHTWKWEEVWHRLSAWIRDQHEQRLEPPTMRWEPNLSWLPKPTITQQLDDLLRLIESRSESIGSVVVPNHEEIAPLIWARHRDEVKALLRHLRDLDRIEFDTASTGGGVRLRPQGLFRLEELAKSVVLNDQLFVAMWFPATDHAEYANMQAAWKRGFEPAITDAGYRAYRVDQASPTERRIDARIMVDIRRSRAVVADATGHRPSVMYEAGFAEGLGKPVIWTVRKDWLTGLPFDTRQFPHLVWETPADLAEQLRPVVENRLGSRGRK